MNPLIIAPHGMVGLPDIPVGRVRGGARAAADGYVGKVLDQGPQCWETGGDYADVGLDEAPGLDSLLAEGG